MIRACVAVVFLIAAAGAATAAPRTIGDCEKIADPDAYNRCLASFGPAMKAGRFTEAPPSTAGDIATPAQPRGRHSYARGRAASGSAYARTRHGRVRMTIDVGRSTSRKATRHRGRRR